MFRVSGFWVSDLGFRVQGLGFKGLGFRVEGLGFRVQCSGWDLGFIIYNLGIRI